MTNFNQKKALLEEMEGLQIVRKNIQHLVRDAKQKIAQAEIQLNAARSTEGFLNLELERKQAVLREIKMKEDAGYG